MANSVDIDQTLHSVASDQGLFAKTYMSQYLGLLWFYLQIFIRFCYRITQYIGTECLGKQFRPRSDSALFAFQPDD